MGKGTSARVVLKPYANKVLNVVKAKYGLKDKSEALNKFVEMHGEEEVELEVKPSYLKKLERIEKEHFKKYGHRHRSIEDLRKEIEG